MTANKNTSLSAGYGELQTFAPEIKYLKNKIYF